MKDDFMVVSLISWPLNESEAGEGDLVLIETSMFFLCKLLLMSMRTASLKGLYQLGGMRNRVPALTEQFEIVVPTFSNTVGEVRKPFPSA